MCMLDRRLQILLDDERYQRLQEAAQARGVSVATIVREAIDRGLVSPRARRLRAAARIRAAGEMEVGDVEALRAELDAARGRRG